MLVKGREEMEKKKSQLVGGAERNELLAVSVVAKSGNALQYEVQPATQLPTVPTYLPTHLPTYGTCTYVPTFCRTVTL
jgi:hypothetical protein